MTATARPPVEPGVVDELCFGCGPRNERGLRLEFRYTGDGAVECAYTVPPHLCGSPTVVHGGIQATILDEVMGKAAHAAFPADPALRIVTAEFSLRYRRPAPIGVPLVARAELVRVDDRDVYLRAEMADAEGTALTLAEARWRVVGPREG